MEQKNYLVTDKLSHLILKFSIPAIIAGLVSAIYNIVDQIFIGQKIGILGNAATNIAFPLMTLTIAVALLFGIGTASNFSIAMGMNEKKRAVHYLGNGTLMLVIIGILIMIGTLFFLEPILVLCGATTANLGYARTYIRIIAYGIPFSAFFTGFSHIIRADGSPKYSMGCILAGALLNAILDPLFIFVFNMGIAGAAYATITGQVVSAVLAVIYLFKLKTVTLNKESFQISLKRTGQIVALGISPFITQISMMVTQIVMNNVLKSYGERSVYGSDIPLACVGIITKINIIYIMFAVGIAQGTQPVIGYNYGAGRYDRVMEAYKKNVLYTSVFSVICFFIFQLFPRQITSVFGNGSEEYFEFAEQYFRIFLFMTFVNGIQPITGNFFTSIGKAGIGAFISLTKQMIFLLPLIVILPKFFGIDGVLYAGPIADFAAFLLVIVFMFREFKILRSKMVQK